MACMLRDAKQEESKSTLHDKLTEVYGIKPILYSKFN